MITSHQLRCEYAQNPLGIDAPQPHFSWWLDHPERNQSMTAYQILVASSTDKLSQDIADIWDSGKSSAGAEFPVKYRGRPLNSGERCYWKVRVWDRSSSQTITPGPYSEIAWFEMALLQPEDWQAEWLGFPANWNGRALYFHRGFTLDKSVRRARVYISGLGYYELRMNGEKIGDHVLDPGVTDYSKRVLYATYDVTDHLQPGRNVLGVVVGNGWYGTPKILCQMMVEYTDGSTQQICSGGGWQVMQGPILDNSVYGGEVYDARLETPGWDTAAGESSWPWFYAMFTDGPGGKLTAQVTNPIRVVQTLDPKSFTQPKPGIWVYDLGQNTAGWAQLTVAGASGDQVTLKFAESLYEDGTVNQENLRGAKATDVYILKGGGIETWEPHFTYHGFRYVQVEGFPGMPGLDSIKGRVVRSSVEPSGEFDCSNDLLNRIYKMVWWTEYSNQHSIPTDCPQRDERMGWLNDLGARSEEAFYNFDMSRFMAKFVDDIQDAQHPLTGAITDTVPFRWGSRPADPVSVSYLLIPWLMFRHYGNQYTLAQHFDGLKHWVDYLTSRAEGFLVSYSYYGDWAPPVTEAATGDLSDSAISRNTPGELISTGYYYYSARLIAQMAMVLGKKVDADLYSSLADKIKEVYNQHFWDESSGGYGSNNQACNAFSLYMGLVPTNRKDRVLANLVRDVVELHHNHLTTGNLCTKYLLEVLAAEGHAEVAFNLAVQTTYPSWGFMLANGATTLWERWENKTGSGMNSHNHPMLGSIGSWFYKVISGINLVDEGTGFSKFAIHPNIVGDLTYANASLNTLRGMVKTSWERKGESLELHAIIPVGSQASIRIPGFNGVGWTISEAGVIFWQNHKQTGELQGFSEAVEDKGCVTFTVGSGDYRFECKPD